MSGLNRGQPCNVHASVVEVPRHTDEPGDDTDGLVGLYRQMCTIRAFENRIKVLLRSTDIVGSAHLSTGQEATAVGVCSVLRPDDYMTGSHRGHGHVIAKGAPLGPIMAELMGRQSGLCHGRGGSMHLADASVGALGEAGIVASSIPVAVGAAFSAQYRGSGQVCVSFFGDGAVNEGAFHEALNLAAVWSLPVLFVCENNGYAVTTPIDRAIAIADIATRAAGYGMPGMVVDGQDVLAVRGAAYTAAERARMGGGPTLIESKTYRFDEHSERLPIVRPYRSDAEIGSWRQRDPIELFGSHLLARGIALDDLTTIHAEVERTVDEAVEFAKASAFPELSDLRVGLFEEFPS